MSRAYVYGLRIVGTDEIRYVGHSHDPEGRLVQHKQLHGIHYTVGNPALGNWIACAGDKLEMTILEETTEELALVREEMYIRLHLECGHRLFNKRSAARRIFTREESVEIMKRYADRDNTVRE